MPIADDIKQHYPDNWQEIREHVLERAADRGELVSGAAAPVPSVWNTDIRQPAYDIELPQCEFCGKPNGEFVRTTKRGEWSSVYAQNHWFDARGFAVPSAEIAPIIRCVDDPLKVVLTVAHLDQDPRIADPARLRALCQRCHLTYDNRPDQRAKRRRIYAELRGQQTLLEDNQ